MLNQRKNNYLCAHVILSEAKDLKKKAEIAGLNCKSEHEIEEARVRLLGKKG